jgi:DNA-binding MarR family transcriptional regulator
MREVELRRAIMRLRGLKPNDKLVLLGIKDCVNWETMCGMVTAVQLSEALGMPQRSVSRALKSLHELGFIRRHMRSTCINTDIILNTDKMTEKSDKLTEKSDKLTELSDPISERSECQSEESECQSSTDNMTSKSDNMTAITISSITLQPSINTDARAPESEPTDWAAKMEEEKQKEREYYRTRPPKRPQLNKMQLALIDGAIIAGQIADTIYARNQYAVKMFGIELLEVQERRRRKRAGL